MIRIRVHDFHMCTSQSHLDEMVIYVILVRMENGSKQSDKNQAHNIHICVSASNVLNMKLPVNLNFSG